jgi:hypothetical protein
MATGHEQHEPIRQDATDCALLTLLGRGRPGSLRPRVLGFHFQVRGRLLWSSSSLTLSVQSELARPEAATLLDETWRIQLIGFPTPKRLHLGINTYNVWAGRKDASFSLWRNTGGEGRPRRQR